VVVVIEQAERVCKDWAQQVPAVGTPTVQDNVAQLSEWRKVPFFSTIRAAAGLSTPGEPPDEPALVEIAHPRARASGVFLVRAEGTSMDSGKTPIPDGAFVLAEPADGRPLESVVDRAVLLQREDRNQGWTFHIKRIRLKHGAPWAMSDSPDGPEWPLGESDRVLALVVAVAPTVRWTPELAGPA
jgi:hypothetical protein